MFYYVEVKHRKDPNPIQFNFLYLIVIYIFQKKKEKGFWFGMKIRVNTMKKNELMTANNMIMFTLIEVFTRLKLNSLPLQINNLHNAI